MVVVVDASALAALLFGEPAQVAVADRLRGAELVAPALLTYELANVAHQKVRRRTLSDTLALEALDRFRALSVRLEPDEPEDVFRLARDTGLTAYDAAYLLLARRLGAPLVTLDDKLRRVADGA
ncbi:MAG: type II toxin-antitoxin system VapC family toxin [Vicinamibacterales bacterium]